MRRLILCAALACLPVAVHAAELRAPDLRDRQVILPKPAEKVVALPAPSAPTLIAIDQSARRLIGMHPTVSEIARSRLIGRLFPETGTINSALLSAGGAAFMPNIEAIAALAPDLVLQRGELGDAVITPLTNAGLPTALVVYGGEDLTRRNIEMIAALIGRPERGQTLIAWRDAVLAKIAAEPSPAKQPSVLFLSRFAGRLVATGAGTPNDFAIKAAGGRNLAAASGSVSVSMEQLLVWNPDVLLLSSMDKNLTPAEIYDDPLLSSTPAAKNKRIYKAPLGVFRWEPPNPENPFFWLWLTTLLRLNPPGFDLRQEITAGFELLYGYRPTDAELDETLAVAVNRTALNYDRVLKR